MNINTLAQENIEYKSYKLPIRLYPTKMRESEDGKVKYHAKTMFRNRINMEDIAKDLIVTGVIGDENSLEIVNIWNKLNAAMIDRILNGAVVDFGIGVLYAKIQGSFDSKQSEFDPSKHFIDIGFRTNKETKEIAATVRPVIGQGNTLKPELIEVFDIESGKNGVFTPGGQLVIKGKNLFITGTNEDVGLYFVNQETKDEVCIKTDKMAKNGTSEIICSVPASLESGVYCLMIKTQKSKQNPTKETVCELFDKTFIIE
ncbi:hypothetical protein MSI_19500 [Treponema sp. JC4]|uniref:DUF4469 domain-containing protein n=1 Tax=Treponema sp. JC4 TaxID=1124982 RepID=UPI00025AFD8D|nr:DUF4469 domain-containing protein [Treponema sp. JC4]EID84530.1 hypothetical protein MSI_19500 [Treponema sp. JC4]